MRSDRGWFEIDGIEVEPTILKNEGQSLRTAKLIGKSLNSESQGGNGPEEPL